MDVLVPLPVAIPLLTAAALAASGHFLGKRVDDVAGIAAAAATAVVSTLLVFRTLDHDLVYWFGGWTPRHGVALGIAFDVEPLSAAVAAFAAVLTTASFVYAWRYFDEAGTLFHVLMLTFLAAMSGFALSGDLFNMFVFFELMTVSTFALVGYQVHSEAPLQGAITFAVTNAIASFFLITGLALVYGRTGALNLIQIGQVLQGHGHDGLVLVAFALLMAGFLIKAGVVPFHFWLSDAYAVAPIPVCVLLSAVMSDLGIHAVARIYWPAFSGVFHADVPSLRALIVGAGILTALLGAAMTFFQRDLKRMLAFLTISHVGVFVCGIGLLTARGLAGSVLYVIGDGFVKAALFLAVGILVRRIGDGDELRLHGRGLRAPLAAVVFVGGASLVAGLPPFGSFLGWALIVRSSGDVGYGWLPPVLALCAVVTGGTLLRAAARIFLGWGDTDDPLLSAEPPPAEEEPEVAASRFSPPLLFGPALALLIVGAGVSLTPGLASHATAWAERLVDRPSHAAEVLAGTLPPPTPPVPLGVGFLPYAYAIASFVLALGFAAFGLYRRRLPGALRRRAGRALDGPTAVLKGLHSGIVGDYVAWLTFGVATLGGLLALLVR
ncbi:MAG TPA: proton-conducting transporter membrane subunit [Gaiellaceae bacterium]|nr:proton-conducting transporter membrane subunit [Gaiellaceae bacterium]